MSNSPENTYVARLDHATAQRAQAHRLWSVLGNIRLAAALLAIVGVWQQWQDSDVMWQIAIVIGVVAFSILAFRQRSARLLRDAFDAAIAVNQRALARLQHAWTDVPEPPDSQADRTHPYAHDLNIVGAASLAQRIGTPATDHGWRSLYDALLTERDLADLAGRQAAIAELAPKLDLRQQVEAVAVGTESVPHSQTIVNWVRESDWLANRQWLRWVGLIGPALVLLCVILVILGILPWPVILIPITINSLAFLATGSHVVQRVQGIVPMREAVSDYGQIMAGIAADDPTTPVLRDLDVRLAGAATAMRGLSRIVNFSIPPGSMLYFPLQMTLMWDVNVLDQLETWRFRHGADAPAWLEAMGEWEALAALSVLTHDYEDWSMPKIDADTDGLTASQLAHPLLIPEIAVANDVEISPEGRFLFVTGSNMSGKSTLLRAIGVNAVLAQAGASICAQKLVMPPLRISSCMRVEDSLAHGVSFFMAELLRLKSVIDSVQERDSRMALYLLDEILQGTNTAERQIASRHVLQQLTQMHAIGAVSSHDLELIEGTSLEQDAIAVHFAEQFTRLNGEPDMTFDYRLRSGLATSSNAIRLMEMLGFEIHENGSTPGIHSDSD